MRFYFWKSQTSEVICESGVVRAGWHPFCSINKGSLQLLGLQPLLRKASNLHPLGGESMFFFFLFSFSKARGQPNTYVIQGLLHRWQLKKIGPKLKVT